MTGCICRPAAHIPMKIRSVVGMIPLFAVWALDPEQMAGLPGFTRRMQWFLDHHPTVKEHLDMSQKTEKGSRLLLAIANRTRLERVLRYVFDENEFLSPYGVRSLSKFHRDHPFTLTFDGHQNVVDYEPAESTTASIRWQFELARTGLVPDEFSADRSAPAV